MRKPGPVEAPSGFGLKNSKRPSKFFLTKVEKDGAKEKRSQNAFESNSSIKHHQ